MSEDVIQRDPSDHGRRIPQMFGIPTMRSRRRGWDERNGSGSPERIPGADPWGGSPERVPGADPQSGSLGRIPGTDPRSRSPEQIPVVDPWGGEPRYQVVP